MSLEIERIELHPVGTPRATGYKNQHVIVKLNCGDVVGVGEMSDMSHLPRFSPDLDDLGKVLNHLLVGRDARNIEAIDSLMLEHFPPGNDYYDKCNFIRCGVDIALYDAVSRALGEPVSTLLGGRVRERFKVCYPIFRHRSPAEIPSNLETVRTRLEQGFDVYRLYVGANLDADVRFLTELRDAFGDRVKIKSLDFSHVLPWKEAREALKRFADFQFMLVESPAYRNDVEGLARFRDACHVPVSEHVWSMHALHQMVRHDAVDIFNIAPIFIGGLTAARRAFAVAHAAGKRCLIGTTQELSVGTAATAQLGAAMANLTDICDATGPMLYTADVVEEPVQYSEGYLLVPDAAIPGLGVSVNNDRLEALASPLSWDTSSSAANILDRTVIP